MAMDDQNIHSKSLYQNRDMVASSVVLEARSNSQMWSVERQWECIRTHVIQILQTMIPSGTSPRFRKVDADCGYLWIEWMQILFVRLRWRILFRNDISRRILF